MPVALSLSRSRRRRMPARAEPIALQAELGDALELEAARATAAFGAKLHGLADRVIARDRAGAHGALDRAATAAQVALRGVESVAAPYVARVDAHSAQQVAAQIRAATGLTLHVASPAPARASGFVAETARKMRRAFRDMHDQVERHVGLMIDALDVAHNSRASARQDSREGIRVPDLGIARADAEFPIEHALGHVAMISGLTDAEREQVATELATAHSTGDLMRRTLAIVLRERYGMARKRARLVARDQISKLNGQLDMDRQIALGVTHFTWVSRGDNRVRPLHVRRDGKVYEWADPPLTNGNPSIPGSDPLCRCQADPVVDNLQAILGNIAGGKVAPQLPGARTAPALAPVRRLT